MPPALLRLRVTAAAESCLRSGHPWLFADSIREQTREGESGELAVVYDRQNRFLAVGLYDPDSPIRLRVLHTGKPQIIDRDWWRTRLEQSLARREPLFDEQTTGYRWINGESDGWPGLVLDRYDTTLVLKLYTPAWFPHLDEIVALIAGRLHPDRFVLRLSRNVQPAAHKADLVDGEVLPFGVQPLGCSDRIESEKQGTLKGGHPAREVAGQDTLKGGHQTREVLGQDTLKGGHQTGPVLFLESFLRFEVDVFRGQKTGFFLDQRENRRRVEALAQGRTVLNAFSFSGGFSLYAARGGATSVTDLDLSRHALDSSRRNFSLNKSNPRIAACPHELIQADAFDWLEGNAERKFDLIILDPPSLAKRETERAGAIRAYGRVAQLGLGQLNPNGILLACSCSAHVTADEFFTAVRSSATKSRRPFTELATTQHAPDHTATFKEAEYLKAIYLRFGGPIAHR
jgi:23S rRNA (cytosine1962-C5)-methyltransferase